MDVCGAFQYYYVIFDTVVVSHSFALRTNLLHMSVMIYCDHSNLLG